MPDPSPVNPFEAPDTKHFVDPLDLPWLQRAIWSLWVAAVLALPTGFASLGLAALVYGNVPQPDGLVLVLMCLAGGGAILVTAVGCVAVAVGLRTQQSWAWYGGFVLAVLFLTLAVPLFPVGIVLIIALVDPRVQKLLGVGY